MPEPTLKDVLDRSRQLEEFAKSIQLGFVLLREASATQGALEGMKSRIAAAQREAESLEARNAGLADEVAKARERLLWPARDALAKIDADGAALRAAQAADTAAFDEERGRRTSILRDFDDRAKQSERDHRARLARDRDEAERDKSRLRGEIEEIRALLGIAKEDLDRTRAEYNQVLDAASRLARPRAS